MNNIFHCHWQQIKYQSKISNNIYHIYSYYTNAYANLSTFFIYDVLYSIMLILWSNNPQLNIYYHIYRCMNCKS